MEDNQLAAYVYAYYVVQRLWPIRNDLAGNDCPITRQVIRDFIHKARKYRKELSNT